jgi:hypothetical protein
VNRAALFIALLVTTIHAAWAGMEEDVARIRQQWEPSSTRRRRGRRKTPSRSLPGNPRETRVFDPYYRIPGSGSDGSGLGLAIAKEIADRHGATIELGTLDDGTGTSLCVRFAGDPGSPQGRDQQARSRAATATASAASPAAQTRSPP